MLWLVCMEKGLAEFSWNVTLYKISQAAALAPIHAKSLKQRIAWLLLQATLRPYPLRCVIPTERATHNSLPNICQEACQELQAKPRDQCALGCLALFSGRAYYHDDRRCG